MSGYEVSDITTPTEAITIDGYTAGYAAGAAGGTVAPSIDGVPTISGTPNVGYTLTATAAPYDAGTEPIVTTWQWYADAVAISGATSITYALTATEQGAVITVEQTATGDGTVSATSTGTSAVGAAIAPVNVLPPQISGTRGGTLTYLAGTYTGSAPITATHVWQTSPYEAGTWTTVGSGATYDDTSTSDLDLRILETPSGPGGAGTPVASRTTPGRLAVGTVDVSSLTPYATSDPNSTLSSGTPLAGTMAAGAVQTFTQGAMRFFAIPRGSDGVTFDQAVSIAMYRQTMLKNADPPPDGRGVLMGLAISSGAAGSGPGGAPATAAQVSKWVCFGMLSNPLDMAVIDPSGTLYIDTTGSAAADTIAIEGTANLIRGPSGGVEVDRQTALQILTGGVASTAGDQTRTPGLIAWSSGDAVALVTLCFRGSTIATPDAHNFSGSFDLLQRGST